MTSMPRINHTLPILGSLNKDVSLTIAIAFLMTISSLAGLLFPTVLYPNESVRQGFLTTDIINLVLGAPLMIGVLMLIGRNALLGLLLWPGMLFYVVYHYIAYAVAHPMTWPFIVYILLVVMSLWGIIRLGKRIDCQTVKLQLSKTLPIRFAAVVLMLFGTIFLIRSIVVIQSTISEGTMLLATEIADLLISPIWMIGGFLMWKEETLGYAIGTSLLFHAAMLFVGLLFYFILQPVIASVPFPTEDFIVILLMGCGFFIPLGLFIRGIQKTINT